MAESQSVSSSFSPFSRSLGLYSPFSSSHFTLIPKDDLGLDQEIPWWAVKQEALELHNKGYSDDENRPSDYSGPPHLISRRAAVAIELAIAVAMVGSGAMECADSPTWHNTLLFCALEVVVVVLLLKQVVCIQYLIIPWQKRAREFKLPLVGCVGFHKWLFFTTGVSCCTMNGLLASGTKIGRAMGKAMCTESGRPQEIEDWCVACVYLLSLAPVVQAFLWATPTWHKVHDENDRPLPMCGKDSQRQRMRWNLDRERLEPDQVHVKTTPSGREFQIHSDGEYYYCSLAEWLGLTDWSTTHYEAVCAYAPTCGFSAIQQMSVEIPMAEIHLLERGHLQMPGTELRCTRRAQQVVRDGVSFAVTSSFLKTTLQLAVLAWLVRRRDVPLYLVDDIMPFGLLFTSFVLLDAMRARSVQLSYLEFCKRHPKPVPGSDEVLEDCRATLDRYRLYHLPVLVVIGLVVCASCAIFVMAVIQSPSIELFAIQE